MQRSTTITGSTKLKPISEPVNTTNRASSAQANLQSHPCFQSSLFNDKERAAGSLKVWKERTQNFERPSTQATLESVKPVLNRDYELENLIWSQSVGKKKKLFKKSVSKKTKSFR